MTNKKSQKKADSRESLSKTRKAQAVGQKIDAARSLSKAGRTKAVGQKIDAAKPLSAEKKLLKIERAVLTCQKCPLYKTRTKAVPGAGSFSAKIMLIGEAPGKNEDLQGLPFVGAAGKFLEEMLAAVGLKREQVFITNVVKCRPPNNRDPLPEEISICTKAWLIDQIRLLDPELIVTLGRHSLNHVIATKRISEAHGKPFRVTAPDGVRRVFFPMYHPAAALYNGSLRDTLVADFKKVPAVLKAIAEDKKKQELLRQMSKKPSLT